MSVHVQNVKVQSCKLFRDWRATNTMPSLSEHGDVVKSPSAVVGSIPTASNAPHPVQEPKLKDSLWDTWGILMLLMFLHSNIQCSMLGCCWSRTLLWMLLNHPKRGPHSGCLKCPDSHFRCPFLKTPEITLRHYSLGSRRL